MESENPFDHNGFDDGTGVRRLTAKAVAPVAKQATAPVLSDYRKLQANCKAAGLSAKGTADQLQQRLAEHAAKVAPQTAAARVTSAPKSITLTLTVSVDAAPWLQKLAALDAGVLAELAALAGK